MTRGELTTIEGIARDLIKKTTLEIETSNFMTDNALIGWLENTKKLAETLLWVCDEAKKTEWNTRDSIAQALLAVDPVEWALAGQQAGLEAAKIARGDR